MKDDFDMHVIYVQADANLKQEFELVENSANGVHEVVIYFKSGNGIFTKIINARRYKKAQQLGLKQIHAAIDLCHVHVPYRPAFLALKLLRDQKTPFVITEHWSGHLTGEYLKKNVADKKLYKQVLKKATGISCVSQLLARQFKSNTGFDTVVIPNYIEFIPAEKTQIPTDRIQLLAVADMIDTIKNISGLISAFAVALKDQPNLHLTLIGGGPDEENIQKQVAQLKLEQHVSLKGRLSHEQVLAEMHHCHFYVCNSNFETFGMTVAEALRCGKPIISTRCGGPEEFLNDSNSILIDPKNQKQLTDAILKMVREYEKYDSEKLADEIEQRFGKEAVKRKLVTFYSSFI
ncbi:MAG: glycosyltransferase [Bacteroidetes bacterium]|nr:glycosyltransferase [Bacteroidota bacterium]